MKKNTETKLIAFHGDKAIKTKYVNRVKAPQIADEIMQGKYWENGRGCAVGCTVHSDKHDAYETELGISWRLARVEDSIFEALSNEEAKKFPLQFLNKVKLGIDTELIFKKFTIWALIDKKFGVVNFTNNKEHKAVIKEIAATYKKSMKEVIPLETWKRLADKAPAYASASAYAYAYALKITKQEVGIIMRDKLFELLKEA